MSVGARVFKGRCTPAEKRKKSRDDLEPAYRAKRAGAYTIRRKPASVAAILMGSIFGDYGYGFGRK